VRRRTPRAALSQIARDQPLRRGWLESKPCVRFVAISFFLLARYVAVEALLAFAVEHQAETSWLGVGLSLGSLLICPGLGIAKRRGAGSGRVTQPLAVATVHR
jgi:hypothetical protein